ncbi:hypothetical protein II906_07885 [bacterium]|nr:hypothetical protein [bacterium]
MSLSLQPAYLFWTKLSRLLVKASVEPENKWFFIESGFNVQSLDRIGNFSISENFVVMDDDRIVAYIEGFWKPSLRVLEHFRFILFDKSYSMNFMSILFDYINYLFQIRGCDVFNWSVAKENLHALKLYKMITKCCGGRQVGQYTRILKSYDGQISDSILFEMTKEDYQKYYNKENC